MKREAIERLAVDRVAGELSEDAEQLLEKYLREHPQADRWAREIAKTYQACSEAVAAEIERLEQTEVRNTAWAEPILPGSGGKDQQRRGGQRATLGRVCRWAAVLAVGLGVGVISGRWSVERSMPQSVDRQAAVPLVEVPLVERQPAGKTEIEDADIGTENFWEAKILAARLPRSNYNVRGFQRDDKFWPNIREYMNKEKHDD